MPDIHKQEQAAHADGGYGSKFSENGDFAEDFIVMQVIGQDHHDRRGGHAYQECQLGNIEPPGDIPAHAGDPQAEAELLEIEIGPEGDNRAQDAQQAADLAYNHPALVALRAATVRLQAADEALNNPTGPITLAEAEVARHAAGGEVVYNDDTVMKIVELMKQSDEDRQGRKGMYTSGILSTVGDRKMAVFMTGGRHAGENLADILQKRITGLPPPIQMCDALSRNLPQNYKVILANCIAHARRRFVDVEPTFPQECTYVLETLEEVYINDAVTKQQNMTPDQRLQYHQEKSAPLMDDLKDWLSRQFDDKKVEPNSNLGQAISYMLNHWKELTLFLRVPKAPLDNNLCERALKKAILHRKNSLFYKTEHGAYIGDLFMSLIHTCNLCKVNPFEYLKTLQQYSSELFRNPDKWMPWNYEQSIGNAAD